MQPRQLKQRIQDILDALDRIRSYTEAIDYTQFCSDQKTIEAVEFNFIVIGEAARQVPADRFEDGRAAYRILFGTGIDHYREHYPPIREWRQREGI